jgi:hypothetical protein
MNSINLQRLTESRQIKSNEIDTSLNKPSPSASHLRSATAKGKMVTCRLCGEEIDVCSVAENMRTHGFEPSTVITAASPSLGDNLKEYLRVARQAFTRETYQERFRALVTEEERQILKDIAK